MTQTSAKQTKYNQYVQKVIEAAGGSYNPEAAAHCLMKDGSVGYVMKHDGIQGLTFDLVTMDEMAEVELENE